MAQTSKYVHHVLLTMVYVYIASILALSQQLLQMVCRIINRVTDEWWRTHREEYSMQLQDLGNYCCTISLSCALFSEWKRPRRSESSQSYNLSVSCSPVRYTLSFRPFLVFLFMYPAAWSPSSILPAVVFYCLVAGLCSCGDWMNKRSVRLTLPRQGWLNSNIISR